MGNNGVKSIILVAVLVVLSFLIGSQISGSRMVSMGIVAASAGLFLLIYLGARSWWLLLLAPMASAFLPIRLPLPLPYVLAPVLLVYWGLLNLMGHARFRWSSLWGMDFPIFILALYTLINFYLHPSSFKVLDEFLGIDSEYISGKEYVLCLVGVIGYITTSFIPLKYKDTSRVIKWTFYLYLLGCLFTIAKKLILHGGAGDEEMDLEEQANATRFTLLTPLGIFVACYVYTSLPFLKLIRKPFSIVLALVACVCVVISGWRSKLIDFALRIFALAALKREITLFVCLSGLAYGTLLFLSNEKMLNDLPFGMQRALCAVPGVHVREDIERTATSSSEWRVVMWRWALDPRTGYIKDYVWGDGFGDNKAEMYRDSTALMRGQTRFGDQKDFARRGIWHSGWITTMHRLGIVGLVIVVIAQLTSVFYFYRFAFLVWKADRKTAILFASMSADHVSRAVTYHLSTGSPEYLYLNLISYAVVKMYYCSAKEQFPALAKPVSGPYVPLLIQEINTPAANETAEMPQA